MLYIVNTVDVPDGKNVHTIGSSSYEIKSKNIETIGIPENLGKTLIVEEINPKGLGKSSTKIPNGNREYFFHDKPVNIEEIAVKNNRSDSGDIMSSEITIHSDVYDSSALIKEKVQTVVKNNSNPPVKEERQKVLNFDLNTIVTEDLQIKLSNNSNTPVKEGLKTVLKYYDTSTPVKEELKRALKCDSTASVKKELPIVLKNDSTTPIKEKIQIVLKTDSNRNEELQRVLNYDSSSLIKEELQIMLRNDTNIPEKQEKLERVLNFDSNTPVREDLQVAQTNYSTKWLKKEMEPVLKDKCKIDKFLCSNSNSTNLKTKCKRDTSGRFFNSETLYDSLIMTKERRKPVLKRKCEMDAFDKILDSSSSPTILTSRDEVKSFSAFYHDYFYEMCRAFFKDIVKSINFNIDIPYCSRSESMMDTSLESIGNTLLELSSSDLYSTGKKDFEEENLKVSSISVPSYRLSISSPFNKILKILLPHKKIHIDPKFKYVSQKKIEENVIRKEKKEVLLTKSKKNWHNLKNKYTMRKFLRDTRISNIMSVYISENSIDVSRIIWNISEGGDTKKFSDMIDILYERQSTSEESHSTCFIDSSIFSSISIPTFSIDFGKE